MALIAQELGVASPSSECPWGPVVEVTGAMFRTQHDYAVLLRDYLAQHLETYPRILHWFRNRVAPGAERDRRVYAALSRDRFVGCMIIKPGPSAKICHLSIRDDASRVGIGSELVARATGVTTHAWRYHVTMRERIWHDAGPFYRRLGFEPIGVAVGEEYSGSEAELVCSASSLDVWTALWPGAAEAGSASSGRGVCRGREATA